MLPTNGSRDVLVLPMKLNDGVSVKNNVFKMSGLPNRLLSRGTLVRMR